MRERTMSPEELCRLANKAFSTMRDHAGHVIQAGGEFDKMTRIDGDAFRSPLNVEYELSRLLEKALDDLARHLVQRLNAALVPNIPINADSFCRELRLSVKAFDALKVLRCIRTQFVRCARQKSMEAILVKARRLLPRSTPQEPTVLHDIQKRETLQLSKHLYSGSCCGWGSFERGGECDAFQKLVSIVLEEADPVTVRALPQPISEVMGPRKKEDLLVPVVFDAGWISRIRFFKNGKVLVTFKAESAAQRVATALLTKPPTT